MFNLYNGLQFKATYVLVCVVDFVRVVEIFGTDHLGFKLNVYIQPPYIQSN